MFIIGVLFRYSYPYHHCSNCSIQWKGCAVLDRSHSWIYIQHDGYVPCLCFFISLANQARLIGLINVILLVYIEHHAPKPSLPMFSQSRGSSPYSSESRGNSPYSFEKSLDIVEIDIKADGKKSSQRNSHSRRVLVKLPTQPPNTFVAPDSWKTTAPRGRNY